MIRACGLPTPKTMFVRPRLSLQRVQLPISSPNHVQRGGLILQNRGAR